MEGSIDLHRAPHRRAPPLWTSEHTERLKELWSRGVSAAKIARELGCGISRSAVLGKIRRLGIEQLSPNARARERRLTPGKPRAGGLIVLPFGTNLRLRRPVSPPRWVTEAKPYVDDPLLDADIPVAQRCSILELSGNTCRWPVGDPERADFFFCGAEPSRDKPYCAAHCERAYRPPAHSAHLDQATLRSRQLAAYSKFGGDNVAEKRSGETA